MAVTLKAGVKGNASASVGGGLEAASKAEWEAAAELVEAQEALVAADERARGSKQANQVAARWTPSPTDCH